MYILAINVTEATQPFGVIYVCKHQEGEGREGLTTTVELSSVTSVGGPGPAGCCCTGAMHYIVCYCGTGEACCSGRWPHRDHSRHGVHYLLHTQLSVQTVCTASTSEVHCREVHMYVLCRS